MKKALLGLILIAAAMTGGLYFSPATLFSASQFVERVRAGLSESSLRVGNLDIRYLEGGPKDAEVLLLVHGFGSDKDTWTHFARYLTKDYRVIAVDLPGFGESSRPDDISYDVASQAERLFEFTRGLGIGRLHLVGSSMGGWIAGVLAARHPQQVLSLTLIGNAGISSPHKSELFQLVDQGKNPLVLNKAEDMQKTLDFVFFKPPKLPERLLQYLGERSMERSAFNQKVFAQLRERYIPLEPELPKITAPTLLLWGAQDRLADKSNIDVMKPLLRQPSVVIMQNCGHVPMTERPEEAAQHYLVFLNSQHRI